MTAILAIKHGIVTGLMVGPDACHVLIGLAIYLALAAARGEGLASRGAWIGLLAVVVVSEGWEWLAKPLAGRVNDPANLFGDVRDDLLWPTVLLLFGARLRRSHAR